MSLGIFDSDNDRVMVNGAPTGTYTVRLEDTPTSIASSAAFTPAIVQSPHTGRCASGLSYCTVKFSSKIRPKTRGQSKEKELIHMMISHGGHKSTYLLAELRARAELRVFSLFSTTMIPI